MAVRRVPNEDGAVGEGAPGNSTDDDLGVHGAFDDHGWKTLCVFDPTGRAVLEVGPQRPLRDLTMAGIFFESRKPPSSEFSFADLEAAFPEGEYAVRAESFATARGMDYVAAVASRRIRPRGPFRSRPVTKKLRLLMNEG